uniref:Uncharacterized protein n=1 Tax=Eubacterium cellulosolvens (strain ATCC 43171 / JCM 9499 / 6) TaxID=633697 RepID=I5AVX9_EUBC6
MKTSGIAALCHAVAAILFCLIGNSSEFPMRQNAPRDAQLADGKIASRFCSRAKVLRRSPQE